MILAAKKKPTTTQSREISVLTQIAHIAQPAERHHIEAEEGQKDPKKCWHVPPQSFHDWEKQRQIHYIQLQENSECVEILKIETTVFTTHATGRVFTGTCSRW